MSSFWTEDAARDFQEGKIGEWEFREQMERTYGRSRCMRDHIRSVARDVEYGRYDPWEVDRELRRRKNSCGR